MGDYIYDFDGDPILNNKEIYGKEIQDAKYTCKDSLKRFDYLDFVIMDVDAKVLPWMKRSHDLTLLFKMCKAAEKPLLAMGAGLSQLMYFQATQSRRF